MPRVLIVDDDPTLVDFLKLLLDSEGYETFEAFDGRDALDQIEKVRPELVLLDYMMPNMHGLDVLRNVKENYLSSFVVMLTGKGSEQVAVECMKAGAADYLMKPFDNDNLLTVVRNVLRIRAVEIEKRVLNKELQEANQRLQKYVGDLEQNLQVWSNRKLELEYLIAKATSLLEELKNGPAHEELSKLLSEIRTKL